MYVLCIEDDENIKKIIKDSLAHEKIDVEFTDSIEESIYKLEIKRVYDVIILDRILPDGDGINFLQYMNRKKINIPCLIISILGDIDHRMEGLQLGAYDYLPKPFDTRELIMKLKNIVKIKYNLTTNIIRIDDVCLNIFSRNVYVGDKRVKLTPQEFKILKLLMVNKNRIIGKSEILERLIENEEKSIESNLVDVLIYRLRKKLGKKDFIQNVKRVGYVINDI
ncbi:MULTISPECIES: response regulator transcription factor [unclassified Nitratiruptor]|uniref:response regulator transcription factor n=1 Tax=unclassified Nitratiruptor TaxID=2624044 RepID=UPI00191599D0|nr:MULTISPECIES: response regulator transcription factor [unclassified Nitratiruptor]BCD60369.1 two-component system, OmpR family, response regulator [Nitratiruptor sp. YY08-10]BCD64142.1 two-component system, OmpR family, response regulator [Nitratiruptor sp. YY08-14]